MAREAKFNFEEESTLVETSRLKSLLAHSVSISGKHGSIRFSKDYIRDHNLDRAFIKLYADKSKKAIAWKILREKSLGDLRGYRQLKVYTSKAGKYQTQHCTLTISKLLDVLEVKPEDKFAHIPIKKYAPDYLQDELHYIELH